jgi:hypothetical protein
MALSSSHRAGRPFRRVIAAAMVAIYLMIALSPLSTLAMQSKKVAHAVTGECAGDCDICGCSTESRASHTCCCWKKRQQQSGMANLEGKGCDMKVAAAPAPDTAQSKAAASPAKPRVVKRDCCAGKKQQHDEMNLAPPMKEENPKTQTIFKCGCPCGNNKQLALWGSFNYEIIPYRFVGGISPPAETRSCQDLPRHLTTRHGDPPDPPPKLRTIS